MALIQNTAEGGSNGTAATTANTGGGSGRAFDTVSLAGSAVINFSNEQAAAGSLGYKMVTNATDAHYLEWIPTAGASFAARVYYYLPTLPSAGNSVLQVRTAGGGTTLTQVLIRNDGSMQVADATGAYAITTAASVFPAAQWVRIEISATSGASTGTLNFAAYLGDSTTAISGSTYNLTAQNMGTSNFGRMRVGRVAAFGTMAAFYVDNLGYADGTSTFIGPATNVPPTVSAGSNQTGVTAGATVNLSATAADSDGSIASIAWTYDYPTSGAPTLTGGTTLTPSFTAGSAGSLYVLRCTVTDNVGATAASTVEVRVPASGNTDARPIATAATKVGTWTRTGGTTDGGVLADESDATYLESSSVSGTEQSARIRIYPTLTRSSGQVELRLGTDTGTATALIRLYEGTTLRQSWTQASVPTTITAYTFTLSGGALSSITDWGNLWVEVGCTT